jgi:hypothetical protein
MPNGASTRTADRASTRPEATSSAWPENSPTRPEDNPTLQFMIQEQLPLTREMYLDLEFPPEGSSLDSDEGLDAELETGLPQEFQLAYQDKPWSMVRSGNPDEER